MRRLVVVVVVMGCGDNRATNDATGDSPKPPDAPICENVVCDDGDPCTADVCDSKDGCRHIALDRCAEPTCGLGSCAGADTDGDGMSDAWETQGYIDVDCDGENDGDGADVQLPGADPNVPDVYVEIDYHEMPGSGASCTDDATCNVAVVGESCIAGVCTHSHRPRAASLERLRLGAARGLPPLPGDPQPPVDLAGKPGFRVHFDTAHSNAIPEPTGSVPVVVSFNANPLDRTLDPLCVGPNAQNLLDLKDANFFNTAASDPAFFNARARVYHYAIATHQSMCPPDDLGGTAFCDHCSVFAQPLAGGFAELPGNDFIISLGDRFFSFGRTIPIITNEESNSIMHELGHNLGLRHGVALGSDGAHVAVDQPVESPTFFSVMNLTYIFGGGVLFAAAPGDRIPTLARLDLSDDTVCADLVEASLVESDGAQCGATSRRVMRYIPGTGVPIFGSATTGTSVDWNNDGTISSTPIVVDLNGYVTTDDTFYTLDEWAVANGKFKNITFDSFCPPMMVLPQQLIVDPPPPRQLLGPPIMNVANSVRPGQRPWIAPRSSASAPVAIYGSAELDVTKIAIATVRLAGNAAVSGVVRDLDGDGTLDLLVRIPMRGMKLAPTTTFDVLQGELTNHTSFVTRADLTVIK